MGTKRCQSLIHHARSGSHHRYSCSNLVNISTSADFGMHTRKKLHIYGSSGQTHQFKPVFQQKNANIIRKKETILFIYFIMKYFLTFASKNLKSNMWKPFSPFLSVQLPPKECKGASLTEFAELIIGRRPASAFRFSACPEGINYL